MTLCLDTSVVVDVLRASKPHVLNRLIEVESRGLELRLCSFTLQERVYGAVSRARAEMQLTLVDAFVARAPVEPWTAEDGVVSARIRADMKRRGTPVGVVDAMIAGQALSRGWPVVTNNVRGFIRIPGLTIIDWSDPVAARTVN